MYGPPWRWSVLAVTLMACGRTPALPSSSGPDPSLARHPRSLTLLPGFSERVVFSGLTAPTAMRFASDGRVFVAEKSGIVKVFASLSATQPSLVADLRAEVYDYWDRGLLDIALDPEFPARPYLYALYTL